MSKAQKPAPSRSKVDDALYEQILLWYVENGLAHAKASQIFQLSRRTLTGLYYSGAKHLNKPPMKLLVNTVEVKARALRAAMKKEQLENAEQEIESIINSTRASSLAKSVNDSALARAEEGAVVAAGRRNILSLQALLTPLLAGARQRARDLEGLLKNKDLDPWELLKLFRELGKFQNDLNAAAKVNMDMERMLMGEPAEAKSEAITNKQDAMRILGVGARTFARLSSEGRIIDGVAVETARSRSPLLDVDPDEDEDNLEPEPFPEVDEDEQSERIVQPEDLSVYFEQSDEP